MIGYFGDAFYHLVYDLVSHEGIDPDHPSAEGRVGQCGMAVYSREDNARLFDGLDLEKMNVVHISYYENMAVLAHYLAYARRRGVPWNKLGGNSMNWYYQSAYTGMTCFPPKPGMQLAAEMIGFCTKRMPKWNTFNIFGYGMEEAGADAVQEVAFSLAAGIDYAARMRRSVSVPTSSSAASASRSLRRTTFSRNSARSAHCGGCGRANVMNWARATVQHARAHSYAHLRCCADRAATGEQPDFVRRFTPSGPPWLGCRPWRSAPMTKRSAIPTEELATLSLRVQQIIQEEVASRASPIRWAAPITSKR